MPEFANLSEMGDPQDLTDAELRALVERNIVLTLPVAVAFEMGRISMAYVANGGDDVAFAAALMFGEACMVAPFAEVLEVPVADGATAFLMASLDDDGCINDDGYDD